MSQFVKEDKTPSLNSADIAILIFVLQNAKVDIGPYPFKQISQLNSTIGKLIKLKEIIDNV